MAYRFKVSIAIFSVDDEITVSKEIIKAINSDVRVRILKSLIERQKTQTELAAELERSLPTVLKHIEQLENAGLITQLKDGRQRKWKYYSLTKIGRAIIEKKRTNFILLLILSMLVAFGSFYLLLVRQYSQGQTGTSPMVSLPLPELIFFVLAVIVSILIAYKLIKREY